MAEYSGIQYYGAQSSKPKMSKEELVIWAKKAQADDETPVDGIFINKERPGGKAEFMYSWWKNSQMKVTLWDGERYTLPKGLVRHIKQKCSYPDYEHHNPASGLKGIRMGSGDQFGQCPIEENWRIRRMIHRFDFELTSYVPGFYEELQDARLFTVEKVEPKAVISKV